LDAVAPDRDALEPDEEPVDAEQDDDIDLGDGDGFPDEAELTGSDSPPAGKLESWRKRSATGAVLTGLALGFQQVFEKEREEPAIIMTTSGDPPRDLPVEAEVEHGRPRRSVVNIRPWLLDPSGDRPRTQPAGGPTDARTGGDQPSTGSEPEGD
jgi:hypothetical protein